MIHDFSDEFLLLFKKDVWSDFEPVRIGGVFETHEVALIELDEGRLIALDAEFLFDNRESLLNR